MKTLQAGSAEACESLGEKRESLSSSGEEKNLGSVRIVLSFSKAFNTNAFVTRSIHSTRNDDLAIQQSKSRTHVALSMLQTIKPTKQSLWGCENPCVKSRYVSVQSLSLCTYAFTTAYYREDRHQGQGRHDGERGEERGSLWHLDCLCFAVRSDTMER
jgi:hypothetical protein